MIDTFGTRIIEREAQGRRAIVDAGCGNGVKALHIATRNPHTKVFGYDVSEEAIKKAVEMTNRRGIRNVNFEVASHESFVMPSEVDLVYTSGSLVGREELEMFNAYNHGCGAGFGEYLVIPRLEKFSGGLVQGGKYINYWRANSEAMHHFIAIARTVGLNHPSSEIKGGTTEDLERDWELMLPNLLIFTKQ